MSHLRGAAYYSGAAQSSNQRLLEIAVLQARARPSAAQCTPGLTRTPTNRRKSPPRAPQSAITAVVREGKRREKGRHTVKRVQFDAVAPRHDSLPVPSATLLRAFADDLRHRDHWWTHARRLAPMKTRLAICLRKARYATASDAHMAASAATITLRPYRCDRGNHYHLTSRTNGKRVPRADFAKAPYDDKAEPCSP